MMTCHKVFFASALLGLCIACHDATPPSGGASVPDEPLFVVKTASGQGYINRNGEIVIPPRRWTCFPFAEGLAPVEVNEKVGYIDKRGRFAIEPKYDAGSSFRDGVAMVQIGSKVVAITQNETQLFVATGYTLAQRFCEGLAAVQGADSGKWGYLNLDGRLEIDLLFDYADDFRNGMARVQVGDKWGVIDFQGKWVLPPHYEKLIAFSEGLARGFLNGKMGFLNVKGEWVIEPTYTGALDFSAGVAPVKIKRWWVYIYRNGEQVSRLGRWDAAGLFMEGLAVVRVGSKSGYIDFAGNLVIAPQFDGAFEFQDGLAEVFMGGGFAPSTWSWIDKQGNVVWPKEQ